MTKIYLKQDEELTLDKEDPVLCLVKSGTMVPQKGGDYRVSMHEHFGSLACLTKTKGCRWIVSSAEGTEIYRIGQTHLEEVLAEKYPMMFTHDAVWLLTSTYGVLDALEDKVNEMHLVEFLKQHMSVDRHSSDILAKGIPVIDTMYILLEGTCSTTVTESTSWSESTLIE